jgi:hypothetical protein
VIPTLRRSRDDVFLIGEEQILIAQEADRDPDPTTPIETSGGRSSRRPRSLRLRPSLRGAGALAALGLLAAVPALLLALRAGGGQGPARSATTSSPRTPLISRSAASVPTEPIARAHRRAGGPAEVHRPTVAHHRRSRRRQDPVPRKVAVTQSEPEREPTPSVAPVSSPAVTPTPSTPAPEVPPHATAQPPPKPGPPPSSSGGGPAGVESFGFER